MITTTTEMCGQWTSGQTRERFVYKVNNKQRFMAFVFIQSASANGASKFTFGSAQWQWIVKLINDRSSS